MKRIAMLSFLLASACSSQDYQLVSTYTFPINNDRPNCFGHQPAHDFDVGPTAIALDGQYVYIVDTYHANIKRIDLDSGVVITSDKISTLKQPWLRDVAVFNDKVYVTSDLDSIYVLSKNLRPLTSVYVGKEQKYFSKVSQDTLEIYFNLTNKILKITPDHRIVAFEQPRQRYIQSPGKTPRGKRYHEFDEKGKQYIRTPYGVVELTPTFRETFMRYDASPVDFDAEKLVYFVLKDSALVLYLYKKVQRGD